MLSPLFQYFYFRVLRSIFSIDLFDFFGLLIIIIIMIANTMEFPCLEASRCYITEREHGLRLSYSPPQTKSSHPFSFLNQMLNEQQQEEQEEEEIGKGKLSLTTNRTVSEEWYVHLDTHSTENGEVRIIQLVLSKGIASYLRMIYRIRHETQFSRGIFQFPKGLFSSI